MSESYGVVLAVVALGLVGLIGAFALNKALTVTYPTEGKLKTYESGVDPVGFGWAQTTVRYFVYAYLYVIFAVDAVYLFPWATVIRDVNLGTASLVEMGIFLTVLVVGLAHAARRGLLRWV